MTIVVTNQKPAVLDAVHTIPCTGDYDPLPTIHRVVITPLLEPLNPAAPASITDSSGNDLTPGVPNLIMRCLGSQIDTSAEQAAKELLGQTLVNFDQATTLPVGGQVQPRPARLPLPGGVPRGSRPCANRGV